MEVKWRAPVLIGERRLTGTGGRQTWRGATFFTRWRLNDCQLQFQSSRNEEHHAQMLQSELSHDAEYGMEDGWAE